MIRSTTIFAFTWLLFWAYWFISGLTVNRAVKSESALSRLRHLALVVIAYALVAPLWRRPDPLSLDLIGHGVANEVAGLAVLLLGVAISVAARVHLGKYWSGRITIKEEHRLIRTGPYALVRHPIYTGLLVGMTGTSIGIGGIHGIIGVLVFLVAYLVKISSEETVLLDHFGDEYRRYRKEVKALVPYVL